MNIMERGLVIGIVLAVLVIGGVFIFINSSNSSSQINPGSQSSISETGSSASTTTANTKEFTMIAKKYEFDPGNIVVNEGDTVILHITSTDVEHGIGIPQFGVSKKLPPGVEETVQFIADKKGDYTFFCNVYCGPGHTGMKGTLTVQ